VDGTAVVTVGAGAIGTDHQSIARGRTLSRPLRSGEKIAPVDQLTIFNCEGY
jgi:hypothetical protein